MKTSLGNFLVYASVLALSSTTLAQGGASGGSSSGASGSTGTGTSTGTTTNKSSGTMTPQGSVPSTSRSPSATSPTHP